jgi:hypothetical protein
MSKQKFRIGDPVRIININSLLYKQVGLVIRFEGEDLAEPYSVKTLGGMQQGWFEEEDLELAEPAPSVKECLTTDNVNHPPHYNQGGIECIEAIKAATGSGFVKYCTGNVIKYLWRYDNKGGLEDLKKAAWYLDRAIKEMEVIGE